MAVRIYMQQNMGLLHEFRLYFFFLGFMLIQSLFGYSTKINNAEVKCDGIHFNCKQGRYCFTFYHNGISYISALIYIPASLNTSRKSKARVFFIFRIYGNQYLKVKVGGRKKIKIKLTFSVFF